MDTSRENVLHWEFAPKNCFAYKGVNRIGVCHCLPVSWFNRKNNSIPVKFCKRKTMKLTDDQR